MVREVVHRCDGDAGVCRRDAVGYRLWREGDRQAAVVDLCDVHAAPLVALMQGAELEDLPTKARVRMEPTQLKPTPKTAHLKKG